MRRIVFTLLFLGCLLSTVYAQDIPLSGKITDNKGLPLSDVTVTVMGTQHVTASDENGNYKINATKGTQIRYTRVGKKIVYVTVGEQRVVNVVMDEGENLDEVVVTGYQTQRKADLTGAVAVVKMDEINAPLTGNVMKSLQGRVPGAFITTSGSPDGSANVLIRGIGTLGNNSPLYIIDGMPSTKSMNEISGLDIESIQILKDASSSSIYGSRAANGVIIITTKKG